MNPSNTTPTVILSADSADPADPADPDLAEQAVPGHGIPSQDPSPAAQTALQPEEAQREANSALAGGGMVAGAVAGSAIGAVVGGPVGVVMGAAAGAAAGAVAGAAGGVAAGAASKPVVFSKAEVPPAGSKRPAN